MPDRIIKVTHKGMMIDKAFSGEVTGERNAMIMTPVGIPMHKFSVNRRDIVEK